MHESLTCIISFWPVLRQSSIKHKFVFRVVQSVVVGLHEKINACRLMYTCTCALMI